MGCNKCKDIKKVLWTLSSKGVVKMYMSRKLTQFVTIVKVLSLHREVMIQR